MPTPDEPKEFKTLSFKMLSERLKRFSVVIVTGGSSGIGCSFIKAIHKLSPEVTLCNLSRTKPDFFFGSKGAHFAVDLSSPEELVSTSIALEKLLQEAPSGEVLLINNSGFGDYGPMPERAASTHLNMIDLNVRAVVDLTTRLLPALVDRGGTIMNIASTAAFQPTPYLATYGATKAFVLNWTLALDEDLRGSGVRAMAVCPGPTRSNFFRRAGFSSPPMQAGGMNAAFDMSADQVAQLGLWGLSQGRSLVVTGWKNKCIAFFGSKLPRVLVSRVGAAILRRMRLGKGSESA